MINLLQADCFNTTCEFRMYVCTLQLAIIYIMWSTKCQKKSEKCPSIFSKGQSLKRYFNLSFQSKFEYLQYHSDEGHVI